MRVIRRLQVRMALIKTKPSRPRRGQLRLAQPDAVGSLFVADHFFGFRVEDFADLWDLVSAVEVEMELVEVGDVGGEHAVFVVG